MSEDCLFCRIAEKQQPAKIVHEDEHVVAFHDINPQAPVHVLVIPRRHVATLAEAGGLDDGEALLGKLLCTAARVAADLGLSAEDGYRAVVNTGERAAQSVFHLHVHLMGGRMFGWPPG